MATQLGCDNGHRWEVEGASTRVDHSSSTCPVCGGDGSTLDAIGDTRGGVLRTKTDTPPPEIADYELLRVIGKGGMGIVYHALHRPLGRQVALKVVLAAEHALPTELARFQAEAETVARLSHPNIVSVYDVGLASGRPFFTMELIEGANLRDRLKQGPMSEREAAELMQKLARATDYAHQQSVVHRDLKPENVLLTPAGEPKITDFGVAKRISGGAGITKTGAVIGTPDYMAPEQAAGRREVGPAADVYALGVVLYECLTGRAPFQSDSVYDTLHKVLTEDPVSPAWYRPGISRDIETICLKCLRKKPEQRYTTAAALADDLERYLAHRPIAARRTARWEHAVKWSRRHPTAAVFLSLLLVLLAAGLGSGWWYYDRNVREHVEYFALWEKRWGSFEGHGKLTPEQVSNRAYSYKFTTRGGLVRRVDAVDWLDRLSNQHPGWFYMEPFENEGFDPRPECSFAFERDASGAVTDEIAYDHLGNVVAWFHYKPLQAEPRAGKSADNSGANPSKRVIGEYLSKGPYPAARTSSGATYVEIERDANGYEVEVRYFDRNQKPCPDDTGAYGLRIKPGVAGMAERITLLDKKGDPLCIARGYASLQLDWAALGVAEIRYLDERGQLAARKGGYAVVRREYDANGRTTRETCLDEHERPVRNPLGFYEIRTVLRGPGDSTSEYFDVEGKPAREYGVAQKYIVRTKTNEKGGREVRESWEVEQGKPARLWSWYSSSQTTYDERNLKVEIAYQDPDGKPTLSANGYAFERMEYDRLGNMVKVRYFDTNHKPCVCANWYAGIDREFQDKHCVRETFVAVDGKTPTLCEDRYAIKEMEYDDSGNAWIERFYDAKHEPTRHKDGYHKVIKAYTDGRVSELAYFQPDGKTPTWHKRGFEIERRAHDDAGNLVRVDHLASSGQFLSVIQNLEESRNAQSVLMAAGGNPTVTWKGNSTIRYEYDKSGNLRRESHFGTNGQPIVDPERDAHRVEFTYDRWGNVLSTALFGPKGEPVIGKEGYWKEECTYDHKGFKTRTAYLGIDGGPTLNSNGIAFRETRPDEFGNIAESRMLGLDGLPSTETDKVPRELRHYNDRYLISSEAYYGLEPNTPMNSVNGTPGEISEYDERGRIIQLSYVDSEGKPTANTWGYAIEHTAYDERGLKIAEWYCDQKDQPIVVDSLGKIHKQVMEYDARGNLRKTQYFGLHGELVTGISGVAVTQVDYDERDNKIAQRYFGPENMPCPHAEGNYGVIWTFNDIDQQLEHTFLGPEGEPVLLPAYGFARHSARYDTAGNLLEDAFYDGAGTLVPQEKLGYARFVRTYENGLIASESYLGGDGRLYAPPNLGYAKALRTYDPQGRIRELRFLGVDDQPVNDSRGYSIQKYTYDENGRSSRMEYFDTEGKPLSVRVVVQQVIPGGAGVRAGIETGDLLVEYEGRPIQDVTSFVAARDAETRDSANRRLKLQRNGELKEISIPAGTLHVILVDSFRPIQATAETSDDPPPP